MIRRSHLRALQTCLLLCCLAGFNHAVAQTSNDDTVYHLHGSVVDGITGKPLARALVQSNDRRLAAMTDSEGRFAIDVSVPAKASGASSPTVGSRFRGRQYVLPLSLTGQKPGYMPPDQPVFLPLDDSHLSMDVTLKLMPAAKISGHIFAAGADSLANVRVALMLHQVDGDGRRVWQQFGAQLTNSRGEFRFSNLRPGEYTLTTGDWRGEQLLPEARNKITERYSPVFYGDETSLATAIKLHLHYGDTPQTELHLHLASYYPVTVPVVSQSPHPGIGIRMVEPNAFSGFQLIYNARDGAVEGLLPNGHYVFLLTGNGPQPGFALATINVDGAPVQTAAVAIVPAGTIAVRIHTQFTRQDTQNQEQINSFSGPVGRAIQQETLTRPLAQLYLRSEDEGGSFTSSNTPDSNPGELTLQNIPPGRYVVRAQPARGYVASISSGGVDLLQQPFVVSAGGTAEPIDVSLRDDSATLTGTVTAGTDPLPHQSFILILPTDPTAQFVNSFAGPDGKFTVPNLVPGSYRIFALRSQFRQIAYRDVEAMHRYDGKGTTITATPGEQVHVDVPLLDDIEAEAN